MPPLNPELLSEARVLAAYLIFAGSYVRRKIADRACGPAARKVEMMVVGRPATRCARAFAICVITTGVFSEVRLGSLAAQEQSARLRVGETLRVSGTETSLTFVSVPRDSRCPKGARCIRAGEAVVVFTLQERKRDASTLTFEVPPDDGASQSFGGYKIRIDRLDPQVETDVEIAPSDYVATIVIQRR